MSRSVTHFSLHRIAGTELRVVSDVVSGVLPVIEQEEMVIRRYAQLESWPHRWVTLFILQDLQPLIRQLGGGSEANFPPGGAEGLAYRPVVNIYDLADPSGCHVFINRQAMEKESYWGDGLAVPALLAHEHAHPLAENDTTRAVRRLGVQIETRIEQSMLQSEAREEKIASDSADLSSRVYSLLSLLVDKLCLYAPRELFANEMTIRSGFGEGLTHLVKLNLANAVKGVTGREDLRHQLQTRVSRGNLTSAMADLLLLIGDLKGYLDLALDVVPFYRVGQEARARELEATLEVGVFPYLRPEVGQAYAELREEYIMLRPDLTVDQLKPWGRGVIDSIAKTLHEEGLILAYRLEVAEGP
ncbi:MAG: hypothetical protein A2Y73_07365 [Chloroflexi bacterium RBG_13_56_8]|nr:MAG: hypothetical protein A2Y73_07365 [Chloroflexi bacterium RBG_13_56_8]